MNTVLANGKRFLAYEIIERSKALGLDDVLLQLQQGVRASDSARKQKHRVFATSTDLIELFDARTIEQKLKYIHANPVSKKWHLVDDAVEHPHSSFAFTPMAGTVKPAGCLPSAWIPGRKGRPVVKRNTGFVIWRHHE
ncbi:MAG: hypothetical protein IPI72_17775 [Flavobacteriales bacterium]|nr:hypothetical protein [Flavobacteriales bacterium]